jgi:hypothetical protein
VSIQDSNSRFFCYKFVSLSFTVLTFILISLPLVSTAYKTNIMEEGEDDDDNNHMGNAEYRRASKIFAFLKHGLINGCMFDFKEDDCACFACSTVIRDSLMTQISTALILSCIYGYKIDVSANVARWISIVHGPEPCMIYKLHKRHRLGVYSLVRRNLGPVTVKTLAKAFRSRV